MAGIAGIARPNAHKLVAEMLDRISHRGPAGQEIIETSSATLGLIWIQGQEALRDELVLNTAAWDCASPGRLAEARALEDKVSLYRDPIGAAPLYFGRDAEGTLCFASEVKALLVATSDVRELAPGARLTGRGVEASASGDFHEPMTAPPGRITSELRQQLQTAVESYIEDTPVGAWLSGGIDSSVMAALARPHFNQFHTFAAGVRDAPDLAYARIMADHINAEHHEVITDREEMLTVLPEVIYHLESFDALLVRSSITNYLVARAASDYVPAVFSGEGGDELFAGYEYLKQVPEDELQDELTDITDRLHNTALQRVDRCSAAHGTVAYTAFLNPEVISFASRVPVDLKLHDGTEKWILRQSMEGVLPNEVLWRPKAKFWEGAGVAETLVAHVEEFVTDADFQGERTLPNGWLLNTKEELFYYRIFKEHFGQADDLKWMGRTKGAPQASLN